MILVHHAKPQRAARVARAGNIHTNQVNHPRVPNAKRQYTGSRARVQREERLHGQREVTVVNKFLGMPIRSSG